jgi:multidrug efflux pump subunit AcrA (membrane-fusion protein)
VNHFLSNLFKIQGQKRTLFFAFGIVFFLALIYFVNLRRNQWGLVEVGEVARGPVIEAIYGLGAVTAENTFQVKIGLTGTVEKIFVKEGEDVRKNQPLLSIKGSAKFFAPFDGRVTSVPFRVGETVYPQTLLMTLMDLRHHHILVSLDQQSAMKVKAEMPVTMNFEGFRHDKIKAKVTSIYPNDNQFFIRIDSDAIPATALPGMTVDVAVEVARKENVIYVPFSAVQRDTLVVGKSSHHTREIKVKTGLIDGANIEIVEGDLQEHEKVYLRLK